jgi:hypothetical protein
MTEQQEIIWFFMNNIKPVLCICPQKDLVTGIVGILGSKL